MKSEIIKVLLVEDNLDDADLLQEALSEGASPRFVITHAELLREACALLDRESFDIVLLDLGLPDSFGLKTLVQTYEHSSADLPIVVLTGNEDVELSVKTVQAGAQDYLVKSWINRELLVRTILYAMERKRNQIALRRSEELFRTVVQNSKDVISIINEEGIIRYASPIYKQVLGYQPEELFGRNVFDLVHPDELLAVKKVFAMTIAEAGKTSSVQCRFRHRDGSWRIFDAIGTNLLDHPAIQGIVVTARDITERKRAEAALAQERNLLRTLIDNLPDYIYVKDNDSRFVINNQAHVRILGHEKPEELLGKTDFNIFPAELAGKYHCNEQQVIRTGQPLLNHEETTIDPQGNEQWLLTTKVPLRDNDDQIIGLVGISRDITERKQIQEKLEALNQELQRSNTELEQFAYIASHDLQAPLRAISSYLQLLERRYGDKLDRDARDFIGYAIQGASRMKTLINDLLTYSRVGTSQKPHEPTDAEMITRHVLANLQPAIEETGAAITHDSLPTIMADDIQLEQLLQNLIGNALKFHSDRQPEIHLGVEPHHNGYPQWLFSVRDNGIGFDPQFAERIFMIFQRLHGVGEYPGTGLGLAICKKIVERHGGQIWVETEPGQGSTFYFTWPVCEN